MATAASHMVVYHQIQSQKCLYSIIQTCVFVIIDDYQRTVFIHNLVQICLQFSWTHIATKGVKCVCTRTYLQLQMNLVWIFRRHSLICAQTQSFSSIKYPFINASQIIFVRQYQPKWLRYLFSIFATKMCVKCVKWVQMCVECA